MLGEFRMRFEIPDGPGVDPMEVARRQCAALELLCQGACFYNAAWIRSNMRSAPACLGCAGVVYERPTGCVDWCQFVDTAPIILRKKRATCLPICCYVVGYEWAHDRDAALGIEPEIDQYDQVLPGRFHATVTIDGEELDPTVSLPGYAELAPCPLGGVH